MSKQKKANPKARPAKTDQKELSSEELDSVAGGVSVQGPAVDTSLSSARNVAPVTIEPRLPTVSNDELLG